jgi:hypothetical protein
MPELTEEKPLDLRYFHPTRIRYIGKDRRWHTVYAVSEYVEVTPIPAGRAALLRRGE